MGSIMGSMRLNAAGIVANRIPCGVRAEHLAEACELVSPSLLVTRRDVFKAAGIAAVVATGALSARSLQPLAEAHVGTHARSAWLRAGWNRALLDPSAFGGTPRLTVTSDGAWRALLAGATFPGTELPAGLELLVTGSGAASRMRVRHELGGFDAVVPLASWLAGEMAAESWVDLSSASLELADGSTLRFVGGAVATLRPDWSLRIEGPGIAHLSGPGCDAVADAVTIGLAGPDAPTLFSRRLSRRSLITLERGEAAWHLSLPEAATTVGVSLDASTVSLLTIETAETRSGARHHAMALHSMSASSGWYAPGGGGDALALDNIRVGRIMDGGSAFHIAAEVAAALTWLGGTSRSLLVSGGQDVPAFECFGDEARAEIVAKPAMRALTVEMNSVIASPLTFPEGAQAFVDLSKAGLGGLPLLPSAIAGPGVTPIQPPLIGELPLVLADGTYFDVIRREDMLALRFSFYNFTAVTTAEGTKLQRANEAKDAYIAVRFPSQHVLEQAIIDTPLNVFAKLKPPLKSYLAGESRLVFRVSPTRADQPNGITLALDELLDWTGFEPVVPFAAREDIAPGTDLGNVPVLGRLILEPLAEGTATTPPETALELPWGLYLSPNDTCRWRHRTAVKTRAGRTELWHTQLRGELHVGGLALAPGMSWEEPPTVRPVWARHYDEWLDAPLSFPGGQAPLNDGLGHTLFRNSLTTTLSESTLSPNDIGGIRTRWAIVDLGARYHDDEPVAVNNLMLSSLGGWLDVGADFAYEQNRDLGRIIAQPVVHWEHRATLGRDQFAKVVTLGRLFPFGHKAVQITITERRVDATTRKAFLGQKTFISVIEPVVSYDQESSSIRRRLPFGRVEIKTRTTPQVTAIPIIGVSSADAYWPKMVTPSGKYLFHLEMTDWDGNVQQVEMPLIWMQDLVASHNATRSTESVASIMSYAAASLRATAVPFRGQKVAFAASSGGEDSNRVLPATTLWFDAVAVSPNEYGDVRYYPFMHQASTRVDAVEQMTGQDAPTTIRIADIYRDNGYGGPNATGTVFAEIVGGGPVKFPAELSGGVATPLPVLNGISATKGVFGGDLAQFGGGSFSPADFFDAMNAELLGGIKLVDVLSEALDLGSMPVFERVVDPVDPTRVIVRYTWQTQLVEKSIFVPTGDGCTLTLTSEIGQSLDGSTAPTTLIRGEIGPFKLSLVKGIFPAIDMQFGMFRFESVNGASPTIDPGISGVDFAGELQYLSVLAQYLGAMSGSSAALAAKAGGVGSASAGEGLKDADLAASGVEALVDAGPFKIDVSSSEISASMTLAIPNITIGVFSLTNLSFSAGLHIPFTGSPVWLEFGFCSRENPFTVTVMIYGGGGYVLMGFDSAGMRSLEVSLEFGVGCTFSIGSLATGMVEVKGGMTFRYERMGASERLDFTAFIRIQGSLEIIGLITVTLTFYLALTYSQVPKPLPSTEKGDELSGTATLSVEVEIAFFSKTVSLSVTKRLAGKDPRFEAMMQEQSDWDEYCEAFARAQLGA